MSSTAVSARADVRARDWREAVGDAAQQLVGLGVAESRYPRACVDLVSEHGPYIVVAPGLALVHARPEEGGNGVGIVATRLAEPVEFGHAQNDPVDLLIAFCSPDKEQHLRALTALSKALTGDLAERLRAAGSAEVLRYHLDEALGDPAPREGGR